MNNNLPILGQTIVEIIGTEKDNRLVFVMENGERYSMHHVPDCCESVYLEDVVGELSDLVGSPLLIAYESISTDDPPVSDYEPESYTWTFYRFATNKGSVSLRWYGESNGYYSETVGLYHEKEWGYNYY